MTSPQQLEILDLRHFGAKQLRPLLEEEAEVWNRRLRWDYRASTEMLLQYLDSRILPGFVALDRGRVRGFCFCVHEGQKAVIGDLYASHNEPNSLEIVNTLVRHLLETLEAQPDVARIEGQLLLFDSGVLPPLFQSAICRGTRFQAHPRLFLERAPALRAELRGMDEPASQVASIPPDLELCRWSPAFYEPAAAVIQGAYAGHLDSNINDQYRTLAGSQRFLHNIIRFPGCGVFDPDASFVLRGRRSRALAAVLLCSRVAPDTGHITQLCVAPEFRGRQVGAALLGYALRMLPSRNYPFLTLTVSENNRSALHLYQASGFRTRYRFDALVMDKQASRGMPFIVV